MVVALLFSTGESKPWYPPEMFQSCHKVFEWIELYCWLTLMLLISVDYY